MVSATHTECLTSAMQHFTRGGRKRYYVHYEAFKCEAFIRTEIDARRAMKKLMAQPSTTIGVIPNGACERKQSMAGKKRLSDLRTHPGKESLAASMFLCKVVLRLHFESRHSQRQSAQ